MAAALEELDAFLAANSYLGSATCATLADYKQCATIPASSLSDRFPHLTRWHAHISYLAAEYPITDYRGHSVPAGTTPKLSGGSAPTPKKEAACKKKASAKKEDTTLMAEDRKQLDDAIEAVQQALCNQGMDSDWTSALAVALAQASTGMTVRGILAEHGWTGTQFHSPPNRLVLLQHLEQEEQLEGNDISDLDMGLDKREKEAQSLHLTVGETYQSKQLKQQKLPCDLIAAGEFEEALSLLKRRLGLVNGEPLEPLFKEAKELSPVIHFSVQTIFDRIKEAHKLTTAGRFADALNIFRSSLQSIPLSVASDAKEEERLVDMIDMCREYVNFCRLETMRKSLDASQGARVVELAAYLTCCKLEKAHSLLTLQLAMTTSFKNQNFVTAASFARRIVQGNWGNPEKNKDVVTKAEQVERVCESKAADAHVIRFDPKAPIEDFKLCAASLLPIGKKDVTVKCPFCGACYMPTYMGTVCVTCQLSEIGANTLGIQLRPL